MSCMMPVAEGVGFLFFSGAGKLNGSRNVLFACTQKTSDAQSMKTHVARENDMINDNASGKSTVFCISSPERCTDTFIRYSH